MSHSPADKPRSLRREAARILFVLFIVSVGAGLLFWRGHYGPRPAEEFERAVTTYVSNRGEILFMDAHRGTWYVGPPDPELDRDSVGRALYLGERDLLPSYSRGVCWLPDSGSILIAESTISSTRLGADPWLVHLRLPLDGASMTRTRHKVPIAVDRMAYLRSLNEEWHNSIIQVDPLDSSAFLVLVPGGSILRVTPDDTRTPEESLDIEVLHDAGDPAAAKFQVRPLVASGNYVFFIKGGLPGEARLMRWARSGEIELVEAPWVNERLHWSPQAVPAGSPGQFLLRTESGTMGKDVLYLVDENGVVLHEVSAADGIVRHGNLNQEYLLRSGRDIVLWNPESPEHAVPVATLPKLTSPRGIARSFHAVYHRGRGQLLVLEAHLERWSFQEGDDWLDKHYGRLHLLPLDMAGQ